MHITVHLRLRYYHKNRYANIEEFKNNLAIRIIVFSDNIMIIDTGENNE